MSIDSIFNNWRLVSIRQYWPLLAMGAIAREVLFCMHSPLPHNRRTTAFVLGEVQDDGLWAGLCGRLRARIYVPIKI